MNLDYVLIAVVVFLLILCACAVPFLIQLQKTFSNINITLQTLNQHLPGIMKNMEDITTNINSITDQVDKQVEGFALPTLRLQTLFLNTVLALENVLEINISKFPLFKAARSLPAVFKGFQVFFRSLRTKDKL